MEGPHPLISGSQLGWQHMTSSDILIPDSLFSLIIFIYVSVTFLYIFYAFCWRTEFNKPMPDGRVSFKHSLFNTDSQFIFPGFTNDNRNVRCCWSKRKWKGRSLNNCEIQLKLYLCHLLPQLYPYLQPTNAKLDAYIWIVFCSLQNDSRIKSRKCFEKFRKLSLWWALKLLKLDHAVLR